MVRRTELKGELKGRVQIVLEDDEREISFITAIGSDSDVQCRPALRPLQGRRFATHVEEYNVQRRGKKPGSPEAMICQELHDKTGRAEAEWKKMGGTYGRITDHRGTVIAGPVFRNDAERARYIGVYNEGRRMKISEA